jgi:hypothetical protein
MTLGIGADKATFVIDELEPADRTKLPPVFLLFVFFFMDT